jgi:hypothetical protein
MTTPTRNKRKPRTRRTLACVSALFALSLTLAASVRGEEGPAPSDLGYPEMIRRIGAAQQAEDEAQVIELADAVKKMLGAEAGKPDEVEEPRRGPARVEPLSPAEIEEAFGPFHEHIVRNKWWRVGDDPTRHERGLRDTASVLLGCVYAEAAGCRDASGLRALAADAADYLLWAQGQTGRGLFPFPARVGGEGREFLAADRFIQRAKRAGRLEDAVENGWIVDDLGDGGLQFDNGVCGAAMVQLYLATKDDQYLKAAEDAAEWAVRQPVVANWNYNSFSVYLLAELARITHDGRLLDAAVKKARLGIYPGQLTAGEHKGRWFDGHNARLPYHYILVRSLVSLASALETDSPEQRQAIDALRLALEARNKDFSAEGIANVDSAFEALLLLEERFPNSEQSIGPHGQDAARAALAAYCVAKHRAKSPPTAPGVWGLYLKSLSPSEAR